MAIGIDDLDDIQDIQQTVDVTPAPLQDTEDTFLTEFLQSKGISDPEKIKFEDENGNLEERSWNTLTKEEKFNILNTPLEVSTPSNIENDLSDDEIDFLNLIRSNKMSPNDYINHLILESQQSQEPVYKIDDLSDDELYLLDLESRVGELTDDEAANALNVAKQNEDFYKKQVEGIRKEYKEREDFLTKQEQATLEEQQAEAFRQYQQNVVQAIDSFNSIGNLDLNFEDSDKEELAEFMLSQDETGVNYLYQALQDPQTLVKAAWFILNGDEAFNNISDYFTNLIKLISENLYKKGLEDGKKQSPTKPVVIIDKKQQNTPSVYKSVYDLED